jgi:hypothetical protein
MAQRFMGGLIITNHNLITAWYGKQVQELELDCAEVLNLTNWPHLQHTMHRHLDMEIGQARLRTGSRNNDHRRAAERMFIHGLSVVNGYFHHVVAVLKEIATVRRSALNLAKIEASSAIKVVAAGKQAPYVFCTARPPLPKERVCHISPRTPVEEDGLVSRPLVSPKKKQKKGSSKPKPQKKQQEKKNNTPASNKRPRRPPMRRYMTPGQRRRAQKAFSATTMYSSHGPSFKGKRVKSKQTEPEQKARTRFDTVRPSTPIPHDETGVVGPFEPVCAAAAAPSAAGPFAVEAKFLDAATCVFYMESYN